MSISPTTAQSGDQPPNHYENFPVASWLCPPHLRAPIAAIYAFARTADDIADEGDAPAQRRLDDLAAMRQALLQCLDQQAFTKQARPDSQATQWPKVFEPLGRMVAQFNLPVSLLLALLDAFEQDVAKSRDKAGYASRQELLSYCKLSANPVGRLLLHLYDITDPGSLDMSDKVCTALQLINFWQDLSVDVSRGRYYVPDEECVRFGVGLQRLIQEHRSGSQTPAATALVTAQVAHAKSMMLAGAPLAKRIPGRAGWELRLVVQGGLRIIDKIEAINYATLIQRPKIRAYDFPILFWRAFWM